jgi:hypothetical protein
MRLRATRNSQAPAFSIGSGNRVDLYRDTGTGQMFRVQYS